MRSTDRRPAHESVRRRAVRSTLCVLGLALAGCGGGSPPDDTSEADDTRATTSTEGRHLGLFFSDEIVEFESCDGVVMGVGGPRLTDLIEMHAQLTPGDEPLEAVFVDVWGEIVDASGEPRLDVLDLRRVAYEGGGCARNDERVFFRGSGNEPFWSVEIGEDGLVWTTPSGDERMAHSGLYDGMQGEWMFDGLDPDGSPVLTVEIVQDPCVDSMSGAWFHLSMTVRRDDGTYRGCAYMSPTAEG